MNFKATYKGNEVLGNFMLIEDNIDNKVVTLVMKKYITDDLPERSYIGEIKYGIIKERNAAYIAKYKIDIMLSSNSINATSGSSMTMDPVIKDYSQTISGEKTFTTLPKSSVVPSDDAHFTNKAYVDSAISTAISQITDGDEVSY